MNLNQQFFRKEARELAWYWVAALVLVTMVYMQPVNRDSPIQPMRGLFGGMLMLVAYTLIHAVATLPFTGEFTHRTMARLLSQPVTRMQIWTRKLALVAAFLGLLVLLVLARLAFSTHRVEILQQGDTLAFLLLIVWAFFSGPLMGVALRQGLTALLASMISPFAVVLGAILLGQLSEYLLGFNLIESSRVFLKIPVTWWVLGILTCAAAHLSARFLFARLEV
jgi:hypothetical protein